MLKQHLKQQNKDYTSQGGEFHSLTQWLLGGCAFSSGRTATTTQSLYCSATTVETTLYQPQSGWQQGGEDTSSRPANALSRQY